MIAAGEDVINFGVGEPDFKTPENIKKAAMNVIENGNIGYTAASGLPELKNEICKKFKKDNKLDYKPDNIIISSGAKHCLYNAFQAICNPGDEVIIAVPYWVSYPELIKMAGAKPVMVETTEEEEFKYTREKLKNAVTNKTKAILLNSPNNPTGTVYETDDLRVIAEIAIENNIYIIADEIYEKLIYKGEHVSIASLGDELKELTIVINGVSKCYSMTGWRIGYAAANKDIVKVMSNIQSHATSNPNTIAQYASIEALSGQQASLDIMRAAFMKRKKYMFEKINSIDNLSCLNPRGAFYIMMNISELIGENFNGYQIDNSMDFAKYLLEKEKVAVVPGIGFGRENYVRLSYATSMSNIKEGLKRIEKALI
ncbi:aminotransferase class I/II-fold pyridoxal phosphate-dependent enzyme [Iocasia frigidifontis]|uniref:Aminotransferase n=2 Tax=Iocasia fonsfrigidae TaxID=2682810 RepID=A0A8A7KIQ6_9FIRM|nr:aminotransferase class I/II-fold pyridoxal phosphate-dependent enzyme [Iocasia fonsfrigidae]